MNMTHRSPHRFDGYAPDAEEPLTIETDRKMPIGGEVSVQGYDIVVGYDPTPEEEMYDEISEEILWDLARKMPEIMAEYWRTDIAQYTRDVADFARSLTADK
jgi:hypothetical protein